MEHSGLHSGQWGPGGLCLHVSLHASPLLSPGLSPTARCGSYSRVQRWEGELWASGGGGGGSVPVELQLAVCMSSPLRKDGRKGAERLPRLPQQDGGLLLCCFPYSCFWGHLISLPMLSLWGAPEKTIGNQVCMRVPSHLCPRAPRRTASGLFLWLSPPKAPRTLCPQQGHVPWHNSTMAPWL